MNSPQLSLSRRLRKSPFETRSHVGRNKSVSLQPRGLTDGLRIARGRLLASQRTRSNLGRCLPGSGRRFVDPMRSNLSNF